MSSWSLFDSDSVDELSCDLIVHLGSIRNIDLNSRGVYTLQISVHSCDSKNEDITSTPVGVFSAPGDVDSLVGDQRIPSTRAPISLCQFDESEKTFCCRSFIIRYREEIHDLNEAAHWKLRFPNRPSPTLGRNQQGAGADADAYSKRPRESFCPDVPLILQPIRLKFELLCCELQQREDCDMLLDIDKLIPDPPLFKKVTEEIIQIQPPSPSSSGNNTNNTSTHQYFPIQFDREHSVYLDCMIHYGVSSVEYSEGGFFSVLTAAGIYNENCWDTGTGDDHDTGSTSVNGNGERGLALVVSSSSRNSHVSTESESSGGGGSKPFIGTAGIAVLPSSSSSSRLSRTGINRYIATQQQQQQQQLKSSSKDTDTNTTGAAAGSLGGSVVSTIQQVAANTIALPSALTRVLSGEWEQISLSPSTSSVQLRPSSSSIDFTADESTSTSSSTQIHGERRGGGGGGSSSKTGHRPPIPPPTPSNRAPVAVQGKGKEPTVASQVSMPDQEAAVAPQQQQLPGAAATGVVPTTGEEAAGEASTPAAVKGGGGVWQSFFFSGATASKKKPPTNHGNSSSSSGRSGIAAAVTSVKNNGSIIDGGGADTTSSNTNTNSIPAALPKATTEHRKGGGYGRNKSSESLTSSQLSRVGRGAAAAMANSCSTSSSGISSSAAIAAAARTVAVKLLEERGELTLLDYEYEEEDVPTLPLSSSPITHEEIYTAFEHMLGPLYETVNNLKLNCEKLTQSHQQQFLGQWHGGARDDDPITAELTARAAAATTATGAAAAGGGNPFAMFFGYGGAPKHSNNNNTAATSAGNYKQGNDKNPQKDGGDLSLPTSGGTGIGRASLQSGNGQSLTDCRVFARDFILENAVEIKEQQDDYNRLYGSNNNSDNNNNNSSKNTLSAAAVTSLSGNAVVAAGVVVGSSIVATEEQVRQAYFLLDRRKLLVQRMVGTAMEKTGVLNSQMSLQWSILMSALPRLTAQVKFRLRKEWKQRIRLFWRRQTLVQLCSHSFLTRPHSFEDLAMTILTDSIRMTSALAHGAQPVLLSNLFPAGAAAAAAAAKNKSSHNSSSSSSVRGVSGGPSVAGEVSGASGMENSTHSHSSSSRMNTPTSSSPTGNNSINSDAAVAAGVSSIHSNALSGSGSGSGKKGVLRQPLAIAPAGEAMSHLLAYGLPVFDIKFHKHPEKLPTVLVQRYIDADSIIATSFATPFTRRSITLTADNLMFPMNTTTGSSGTGSAAGISGPAAGISGSAAAISGSSAGISGSAAAISGPAAGLSLGSSDFELALQGMQVKELYSAAHPRSSAASSMNNSEHGITAGGGGSSSNNHTSYGHTQILTTPYEYMQQLAVSEGGLLLTSPPDESSSLYAANSSAVKVEDVLAYLKMNPPPQPLHPRSGKSSDFRELNVDSSFTLNNGASSSLTSATAAGHHVPVHMVDEIVTTPEGDEEDDSGDIGDDDHENGGGVFMSVGAAGVGIHVIVLMHGLQGNSHDMALLRNAISVEFPHAVVLCAKSSEKNNEDSIVDMAERLAKEVTNFCAERVPSLFRPASRSKISFIGHSLGGLVIRKALENIYLRPLLPKMHTYISLATPHLGTLYAESPLVSTGMWALFRLKGIPSLKELVLEDGPSADPYSSQIYQLSTNGALQYFKHVVVVSSPRDQYVPTYSARMQICARAERDITFGPVLASMVANILSQVEPDRLVRVTIDNNVTDSLTVDAFIGRSAHIAYLDSHIVAMQVIQTLQSYLR